MFEAPTIQSQSEKIYAPEWRYQYPESLGVQQQRALERQMGWQAIYGEKSEAYNDLGGVWIYEDPLSTALLGLRDEDALHRMAFEHLNIQKLLVHDEAFDSMTFEHKKQTALQVRTYTEVLLRYSRLARTEGSEENVRRGYGVEGTDNEVLQSGRRAQQLAKAIQDTEAYKHIEEHTFTVYRTKASWERAVRNRTPHEDFFIVTDTKTGKLRVHIEPSL